ncbi:hypothetical protein ACLKA7_002059 [Drosophila subpalustris]
MEALKLSQGITKQNHSAAICNWWHLPTLAVDPEARSDNNATDICLLHVERGLSLRFHLESSTSHMLSVDSSKANKQLKLKLKLKLLELLEPRLQECSLA